jgi:cystathionine gamma-synthase
MSVAGLMADASDTSDTSDTFSAESRLIHAGTDRTPGLPATPPLAPTSVYVSAGPPRPGRAYGRDGNPGWEALEQALGGLEDAEAVAFASGQAASMALMLALAPGRDRIVLPNDGYYGVRVLADRLRPHGAVPVPVDLQDLAAVECELTAAPSVLWAETPTNPLLRVADLARLGELAAAADAPMVVDNTVATGLLQRPLEAGAMASLYSLTKSVSGHSDVILGAVVSRDAELLAALRAWRSSGGGIPGPFEAWLALRGLKTLPLRIARQSHTALAIARHLTGHPRVAGVHYPGIDTSTSEVARRQMPDGFGPLLSFEVLPGNAEAADTVVASSRLILPATSFGGVESTWERRARWPGETASAALIRMSVGVEPVADLITDLDHALGVLLCDILAEATRSTTTRPGSIPPLRCRS